MSRVLFLVAAAIALSGVLAAAFVPVETLGDREAFFARLIMFGPAVLVAVIVFALAAVVHKLTRLEVQGEEMLDRLYAAFPGEAAPRPTADAPPAVLPEAAQPPAPPPEPVMAPPAPVVTPPPVAPVIPPPPALEPARAPVPEPPAFPPTPMEPPQVREPVLPPLSATPSEPAEDGPPARQRGFRFGRFSFGRNKAATAAGAAAVGAAGVEAAADAEPPVMPPREDPPLFEGTPDQPFRSEPAPLPPLEADLEAALSAPASDRPVPPPQEDDLAARLSAALMAANAATEPVRPIEPDWPDLAPPTRDDQVTRIGADALSEALLGVGPDEPNLSVTTPIEPVLPPLEFQPPSAPEPPAPTPTPALAELEPEPEPELAPEPAIMVAEAPSVLPVPEPAPEPMPAPVPEAAPLAPIMPPAPIADAAPPADAPARAPTVAEYMARPPEAETEAPLPKIVREGQFAGRQYRMFEDGSLEIFTEQSTLRFGSLEEFRSFVASGGRRPPEGAA